MGEAGVGSPLLSCSEVGFLVSARIPCTPGLLDAAVSPTCLTAAVLRLQMFATALGFVCVFQGFHLSSSGLQSKGSYLMSPVPHLHPRAHAQTMPFYKESSGGDSDRPSVRSQSSQPEAQERGSCQELW